VAVGRLRTRLRHVGGPADRTVETRERGDHGLGAGSRRPNIVQRSDAPIYRSQFGSRSDLPSEQRSGPAPDTARVARD